MSRNAGLSSPPSSARTATSTLPTISTLLVILLSLFSAITASPTPDPSPNPAWGRKVMPLTEFEPQCSGPFLPRYNAADGTPNYLVNATRDMWLDLQKAPRVTTLEAFCRSSRGARCVCLDMRARFGSVNFWCPDVGISTYDAFVSCTANCKCPVPDDAAA